MRESYLDDNVAVPSALELDDFLSLLVFDLSLHIKLLPLEETRLAKGDEESVPFLEIDLAEV